MAIDPTQPTAQPQETFLQRQQRVHGQQSATSPVSSTGRITAQPAQPQQPLAGGLKPATAPAPQPVQYQRPQTQPFQQPSTGQAGANQVAGPQGGWATYQPQTQVPVAQQYQPGPQNTYQAAQVQQFQAPRDAAMDQQQRQMVTQLLQNPTSMSQQTVDQMKQGQTEQALAMQRQMLAQLGQGAAGRNIDPDSGFAQMLQRQAMQDTQSQILGAHRGIDIEKAKTDRADVLGALGAADAWQNSNLGRAVSSYQTGLQGLGEQRGENLAQLGSEQDLTRLNWQGQQQGFADAMAAAGMLGDEGYRAYQSQFGAQNADQQRQAQNMGLLRQDASNATQNRSLDLQNSQFGQSLGFDREKFSYAKEQDAAQMAASQAAASAADDRWADQMAMQYQQQQMDQYNALLRAIMGGE